MGWCWKSAADDGPAHGDKAHAGSPDDIGPRGKRRRIERELVRAHIEDLIVKPGHDRPSAPYTVTETRRVSLVQTPSNSASSTGLGTHRPRCRRGGSQKKDEQRCVALLL